MSGTISDLPRRERRVRHAKKRRRAAGIRRAETAAQLHRRMQGEYWVRKDQEWANSPLNVGRPLPRRSAASRLRELELHPDRLEALKARP